GLGAPPAPSSARAAWRRWSTSSRSTPSRGIRTAAGSPRSRPSLEGALSPELAFFPERSILLGMARKPPYRAVAKIDPAALASFQAGIRKRYSNEQILRELRASAERLGRSPTMREFAADEETTVHPQTVIEHVGSWNAAKRES